MTRVNVANRRCTGSAGRWLARALLVVGGTLAGIATGWAINTATASADTVRPDTGAADNVAWRVADPAGHTVADWHAVAFAGWLDAGGHRGHEAARWQRPDDAVRPVHTFARTAVLDRAESLFGLVEQITRPPAAPGVTGTAQAPSSAGLLGFLRPVSGQLLTLPLLHGGKAAGQPAAGAAPGGLGQAAPASGRSDGVATVLPRSGQRLGMFRHGPAVDHHGPHGRPGTLPASPVRGPLSPAGLPFSAGVAAAGGHFDDSLSGVPVSARISSAVVGLGAVRFGVPHAPAQPGSQPGVTPD